jgi:phosphatidylglycerophosphate synthase
VTLLRATLVLPVVALTLRPGPFADGGYWWIIGISTLAMVLDGVDGVVARRTRTESAFGARFDMEVDALLLLALSWLVWQSGKAGPWVLLIGALRYMFVLAGQPWPALRRELPPSLRRKIVCVVQGVALLVCLGPIIPRVMATVVAGAALLLLVYSFAVDVWILVRPDGPDRSSTVEW